MATPNRVHARLRSERGEVSSWLIVAAALAAAAVLASATLQMVTSRLAADVAAAAEVGAATGGGAQPPVGGAPGGGDTGAPAGGEGGAPSGGEQGVDQATTQILTGELDGVVRQVDGQTVMLTVDENGFLHFTRIDDQGRVERFAATISDDGRIRPVIPVDESGNPTGTEDLSWSERLSSWHFEGRDGRNINLPTDLAAAEAADGWVKVDAGQAVLHQDPNTPGEDYKFVHPDGREAVYNSQTGEMVTSDAYRGTYNFVHMPPKPEEWSDVGGWVEWGARGIGHTVTDVIPWWFGGVVRGDDGGD